MNSYVYEFTHMNSYMNPYDYIYVYMIHEFKLIY